MFMKSVRRTRKFAAEARGRGTHATEAVAADPIPPAQRPRTISVIATAEHLIRHINVKLLSIDSVKVLEASGYCGRCNTF